MSEHPIIFSAESVEKILAGRKTQTRRVVRARDSQSHIRHFWDEAWADPGGAILGPGPYLKLPFLYEGGSGEKLVERVHCPYGYPEDGGRLWVKESWTANGAKRSPIFMPRALCRLTLQIVAVRCERLRAISNADVKAEGAPNRETFASLWTSLNGKRGYPWSANPWVWAIEFKMAVRTPNAGTARCAELHG